MLICVYNNPVYWCNQSTQWEEDGKWQRVWRFSHILLRSWLRFTGIRVNLLSNKGDVDIGHMPQLFLAVIMNLKISQFTTHGATLALEYIIRGLYSQYTRD